MRKFILCIVSVFILFIPCVSVYASDANVQGNGSQVYDIPGLGEMTEEDIAGLGEITQELISGYQGIDTTYGVTVVREPETVLTYNDTTSRFRYTLPDGEWIECNIPQGALYRGSVVFNTSDNISSLSALRDGSAYTLTSPYQESGSYVITFWDISVGGDANMAYRFDYVFTLCSDPRMNISLLNAPLGMEIEELSYEGRIQEISDKNSALLVRDGDYHVLFTGDGVYYEMNFTRDTVPPVLEITPEYRYRITMDENPRWSTTEQGTIVTVKRNYTEEEMPYGELLLNGFYQLTARDSAGNERTYEFTVKAPLPFFTPKMLIIPTLLILAAIAVAIYTRRNMSVR